MEVPKGSALNKVPSQDMSNIGSRVGTDFTFDAFFGVGSLETFRDLTPKKVLTPCTKSHV